MRTGSKLRVHILYEHSQDLRPHGCSYIRLLLPLAHSKNSDVFTITYSTGYARADILIIERTWKPYITIAAAEDLIAAARSDGACVIYSIDDNLLDLQPTDGVNNRDWTERLMAVRYFVRSSDGVLVSTSSLKSRLGHLNDRIVVVPNALYERLWKRKVPKSGSRPKTIGFMGTYTHDSDLRMVLQSLREVLRKNRTQVEFQLIAGFCEPSLRRAFDDLPIRTLDVGSNVEYPAFVRWFSEEARWDLAIAPLEETEFNRCKSDMKFLDYSALGIAGLYSRVPSYESTVSHLETGFLVQNDVDSWVTGLEFMLNDEQTRRRVALAAQEYVFTQRTLAQRASDWQHAILTIAGVEVSRTPK